ncbi:fimbrial protein [Vibrio cyclitrophicus]
MTRTSRFCLLAFFLPFSHSALATTPLIQSEYKMTGTVVSSTCSVVIEHNASQAGVIDFGLFNKARESGELMQTFSVKLYESGAPTPGCSAFLAGSGPVSLEFGERMPGQLDAAGVVTRGAGDQVRISITATDINEVSNTNPITENNAELLYSQSFASQGVFGFNATAKNLNSATSGSYSGSLSLMVTYQ